MITESPTTLISLSDLDSVASLRSDSLHGEDDLEGVLGNVSRRHVVQWRLLIDLVTHHHGPEHLEEVLTPVHLNSKVHRDQMIRNILYKQNRIIICI